MNKLAVAIAHDVLQNIDSLSLGNGSYLHTPFIEIGGDTDLTKPAQCELLKKECQVCALGACLLSFYQIFDKNCLTSVTHSAIGAFIRFYTTSEDILEILGKVFDKRSLTFIEVAFEENPGFCMLLGQNEFDANLARKVRQQYAGMTKKERLQAIMQNIITNEGRFEF